MNVKMKRGYVMNNISDKEAINAKLSKWYEENKARYNLQDKLFAMLVWQAAYKSCLSEFEQATKDKGELLDLYLRISHSVNFYTNKANLLALLCETKEILKILSDAPLFTRKG